METGESVIPIVDFDIRKPDFKKDQERVLDSVRVLPISDERFDDFRDIYTENKDFYGLKIYTSNKERPKEKIYFRQNQNGIALLQKMTESKGGFFCQSIKVADGNTENFFDVLSLRREISNGDLTLVFRTNKLSKTSVFGLDGSAGVIHWNENEAQMKMLDWKFGRGSSLFFSLFGLFHELGHNYQFDLSKPASLQPNSKDIALESMIFKKLDQKDKSKLELSKQLIKEEERNASAFALSLILRLKHSGLDLTRGLTGEQISKGVDLALLSYDNLMRLIPGNEVSNRMRKRVAK